MNIKLLTAFLLSGFAVFAQQNEIKKIVTIKGNDTTVIVINGRIDQMDSMLTEEMKKVYINDSMVTRVDVFMDTTILKTSENGSDTTHIKIGNMKIVILESKDLKNGQAELKKANAKSSSTKKSLSKTTTTSPWKIGMLLMIIVAPPATATRFGLVSESMPTVS